MAELIQWLDAHAWAWPMFIIVARIVDVSLGTLRTIMVIRGHRVMAAGLGFFEVLVWIIAVSGVLQDATFVKVVSYAVGFAAGNAVGIIIDQKLGIGMQMISFVSSRRVHSVAFALRLADFRVTEVPARGERQKVALGFTVVSRRQVGKVFDIARGVDPDVQLTIHDVRSSTLGIPQDTGAFGINGWRFRVKKK